MIDFRYSILIFLFSFINLSAQAQDNPLYSTKLIPEKLLEGANDIVRFEHKQLDFKSAAAAHLSYKTVVTIFNTKSKQNSLYISYDGDTKVKKIKAKLFGAAGNLIRKVDNREIQDFSAVSSFSIYEDDRVKYLELNHNEFPYTVEFEYELELQGVGLWFWPNWSIQDYNSAIQQASYNISLPEYLKLYYQNLNIELTPQTKQENQQQYYSWLVKDLLAKKREAYGPTAAATLPGILVSLDQFQLGDYKGSMASWQSYGAFVHSLYEGRDQLSQAMTNKIKELTKEATSTKEKIEILYRYLQENTRYVSVQLGIGGFQPFDAQYVEKNKYGDCKALTNFMMSMLRAVGIESNPVLIYRGRNLNYEVTEDFTTSKFNHVLLNIPSEEGYEVESIPQKEFMIESPFGHYTVKVTNSSESINYSRQLQINSVELPPAAYEELRSFFKSISKADKMKIVLIQKKT